MRILLLLFVLISCSKEVSLEGNWNGALLLQNKKVPFEFSIDKEHRILTLKNAGENIRLFIQKKKNLMYIPIQNYDSALTLHFTGKQIEGVWEKFNRKKEYKLKVSATKQDKKKSSNIFPKGFPRKWKITFQKDDGSTKDGILLFTKNYASVITQTGDYRFLRPVFSGDKLNLYGFDAAFSFNFEGEVKDKLYQGTVYSGTSWNRKFTATPDENFELKDPRSITALPKSNLDICLDTLSKKKVCLNEKTNRPKVIQIFGSWCPNCIDETIFVQQYRKKHNPQVDFYLVSFERAPNKKTALRLLTKTKGIYRIDYPILLGGFTSDDKVSKVFKDIKNFASFPTTIYVDKKGEIRKVHSGFNGPATGKYFEEFSFEFDAFLKKLQSE